MMRWLAVSVLVANLAGAAWAATADAKDVSPEAPAAAAAAAPASTPETEVKDRGWFSRVNPFSPLINTEAMKKTSGDVPVEDVKPSGTPDAATPKAASPATQAQPAPEIPKLNGVLFSEHMVVAIVNDTLVKVGDLVDGYRITSIGRDSVEAQKGGVRFRMTTRRPQAEAEPPISSQAVQPAPAFPAEKTQSSSAPQTADNPGVDESNADSTGTRPASAATEGSEQAP